MLTWTNPGGDIDQVVVKIRTQRDQSACNQSTSVLDYWFYSTPTAPQGCPGSVTRRFPGSPPTSLIIPPGILRGSVRCYWSVWVRRAGAYISSTGYVQGLGGNQLSSDFFDFIAPTFPLDRPRYGIGVFQYYSEKADRSDRWKAHLDWAASLLGPGGYVKLFFPWVGDPDAPLETYQRVLSEAYARRLIPIVRVQGTWARKKVTPDIVSGSEYSGSWRRPPQDGEAEYAYTYASGTYQRYARDLASFVGALPVPPSALGEPLYVELWNEVNYNWIEWSDDNALHLLEGEPENYARFFAEAYRQIQGLGRSIELMNGGLGRAGYGPFMARMLDELYRLDRAGSLPPGGPTALLRNFATHLYPDADQQERQVSDDEDGFARSPFSYKHQLDILHKHGIDVSAVRVFVTEAGYIGRPTFDPDAQTRLTLQLIDLWADDPRLRAIAFFSLDDYTDRVVFPYIQRPLDSVAWVPDGSGTAAGLPTSARPVYAAARSRIAQLYGLA
jgi:hypothetical protein